ncbi:GNAT family N-acetyltransferase [Myxococcus sp. K15C18031901]|uniref:GNAT family N-acetyltransferase n=1 Tax=Myxococcus dinghuensis TaxID=2906761 RepID=UPI0020A7B96E|nr:GNAT family N-acetyltransferase [Myxococcus dinghuensis]MCP3102220.1 GNAT family N-acetyltransferase [Myxococcus dinghuensis]
MSQPSRPVVDVALARRIERAQAEQNRSATPAHGILDVAGGRALFNGPGSPLTQALALGLDEPVDAAMLDRLEAHLGQGGGPMPIELTPFAHPSLAQELARRGYRVSEFQQVFARALPGAPLPTVGAEARPIRPAEAALFARTVGQGFLGREELTDDEAALMLSAATMAGTTCFLAWADGEPAGGGTVAVHDGVATLSGTGVRERFRGLGLQQALIAARLAWALDRGCTLASSSTHPGTPSQRNMERLGFFVAYPKVVMVREAPGA